MGRWEGAPADPGGGDGQGTHGAHPAWAEVEAKPQPFMGIQSLPMPGERNGNGGNCPAESKAALLYPALLQRPKGGKALPEVRLAVQPVQFCLGTDTMWERGTPGFDRLDVYPHWTAIQSAQSQYSAVAEVKFLPREGGKDWLSSGGADQGGKGGESPMFLRGNGQQVIGLTAPLQIVGAV